MASFQGLPDTLPASAKRLARLPSSILVIWAMAFAFIAMLIGGWRHTTATVEKHLQEHALAVAQLAAERSALAFDNAGLSLKTIIDNLRPGDFNDVQHPSKDRQAALHALEEGFVKFCRSQAFDEKDFIGLSDGANGPLAGFAAGRSFPDHLADLLPMKEVMAAESTDDVHYVRSPADDVDRLVVVRKLPRYPFYVTYGRNVESLVVSWRYEKLLVALAAVLALIVTFFVNAGIRRRLALTTQLQHVRGDLEESNGALRAALAAAELLAAKDQLTGLWNRRSFDQRLEGAIAHLARHEGTFALLLIDLDHFKSVNDRCGHVGGDEVLKRFADVLHERLRQNDVDARWGGEEFVVLADGASLENAFQLAEQVREAVELAHFPCGSQVTVSIGVAEYRQGETGDELLTRADNALYEAKRNGRNRVMAAEATGNYPLPFSSATSPAPLFAAIETK